VFVTLPLICTVHVLKMVALQSVSHTQPCETAHHVSLTLAVLQKSRSFHHFTFSTHVHEHAHKPMHLHVYTQRYMHMNTNKHKQECRNMNTNKAENTTHARSTNIHSISRAWVYLSTTLVHSQARMESIQLQNNINTAKMQ